MDEMLRMFVILIISVCLAALDGREIKYSMDEENEADYTLGNIADDANIQDLLGQDENLSDLRYNILTQGNEKVTSKFIVDGETSVIQTTQVLDRDSLCRFDLVCVFKFDVVAQSDKTQFFHKISVIVTVNDVNDNAPTFPSQVVDVEIPEDAVIGSNTPLDGASDLDTGNNSVQHYRIFPDTLPFQLNAEYLPDGRSKLRLDVDKTLDREKVDRYKFQIFAEDRGNPVRTGTVILDVRISDVNDNSPKFDNSTYNVSIGENFPVNSMLIRVRATDGDIGENGRVSYRLSQRQSSTIRRIFSIHPVSGEITLMTSLMAESSSEYKIIVEATDNATRSLSSQAQVFVTVLDTHNDAPEIKTTLLYTQKASNFIQIEENVKNATVIAVVTASDRDKGLNGQVDCRSNDTNFHLEREDGNEYNVVVYGELNREASEWRKVQIKCQDRGTPPLNSYDVISVRLIDVNDNAPVFPQSVYRIKIPENTPPNSDVFKAQARDNDATPSNITYFLNESSNSASKFYIDETSGTLFVKDYLDRETVPFISIIVYAQDDQLPVHTGSTIVEVIVTDVNDNSPYFVREKFVFEIEENKLPGTIIGEVIASDYDEGRNAELVISGVNMVDLPFTVMANGSVFTTRSLDREAIANYTFTVIAKDGGDPTLTNNTKVLVHVLDENDNDPKVFIPEVLRVSQYTLPNTVVLHVNASDDDSQNNGKLVFDIENHDNITSILSISQYHGQLTLKRSLTSDDVGQYKCVVIVRDSGTTPRTASVALTVFITQDEISTQKYTSEESIKYYAIAVAICCVTIVLSAVIILVICLIRRKDRMEGDKTNSSITSQVTQESDLTPTDLHMNGLFGRDYIQGTLTKSFSGRKKEKQVTFKSPYIAPHVKYQDDDSDTQPEVISEDVTIWDWDEQPHTHAYRAEEQYSPDELPNLYGVDQRNYSNVIL